MAKASPEILEILQETLEAAVGRLPKVTGKKMFGCHSLWAKDAVFAMVWKEGRIGLRLTDEESFERLLGFKGAEPWKAGTMVMSHWVLVPEGMHKDKAKLKKWVAAAYKQALSR